MGSVSNNELTVNPQTIHQNTEETRRKKGWRSDIRCGTTFSLIKLSYSDLSYLVYDVLGAAGFPTSMNENRIGKGMSLNYRIINAIEKLNLVTDKPIYPVYAYRTRCEMCGLQSRRGLDEIEQPSNTLCSGHKPQISVIVQSSGQSLYFSTLNPFLAVSTLHSQPQTERGEMISIFYSAFNNETDEPLPDNS